MKKGFVKNYFKIYLWRFLALISRFLSFLFVIPSISRDVELFGIYSFILSFSIYLSYSDIGFLSAGWKYASKVFIENKKKSEAEILGFIFLILIMMCIPFSIVMFMIYFNPSILINESNNDLLNVISGIAFTMSFILPFQIILQRLVQSILVVRIKDYIFLRIDFFFNLIKVFSVFYFFNDKYLLFVEYYFFITIVSIISSLFTLFYIVKYENFYFKTFFTNIKFSKYHFNLTKKLALSSLFGTISYIIYYELDLIIIKSFFNSYNIGIYAIGFTFLGFLKNLWSIVYSPYSQRFNHFSDHKYLDKLKLLATNIVKYTFPLTIVVSTILIIFAEELTIFWVGEKYYESVQIIVIMIISSSFGFITQPASYFYISKNKYNYIYITSTILPFCFITCLFILVPLYGIIGVAMSKAFAMFCSFIISLYALRTLINSYLIFKKWILQLSIFIIIMYILFPLLSKELFFEISKSTLNLVLLCSLILLMICVSYLSIIISDKESKFLIIEKYRKLFNK